MKNLRKAGFVLLIKAIFVCLLLGGQATVNTAAAGVGFDCDKGKAPNSSGRCVPCGHKNQPACEPMRKGPQCYDYLEKINGVCVSRGGEGDQPYSGMGFDCKPGYNVGSNGRCTRCGGKDQVACEPVRKGAVCKGNLEKYQGYCRAWGKLNEKPWPKIKPGFPCDDGLSPSVGDEVAVCVPCGHKNQPKCHAGRKGPQCFDYLGEVGDQCLARGGEGELRYEGMGFDCKPGFNVDPDDKARCTACGGLNQPACEPMRKGAICNEGLTLSNLAEKTCVLPPYKVADPFKVYNRSDQAVFASVHWILPEGDFWTMDTAIIPAKGTKEFPIAGKLACYPNKFDSNDANVNPLSGLFETATDSCMGQHFQVIFWDSKAKFTQYATEMSLVAIGTALLYDYATGKIAHGLLPLPDPAVVADAVSDLWRNLRDPSGTMATWGVHDWAMNVPQQHAWVAYWGKGTKSDVILDSTPNVGNRTNIAHPMDRTPQPHVWFLVTNQDGEVAQTNQICRDMCQNPNYTRSRAPVAMASTSADTTGAARAAVAAVPGFNTLGLWDFEVNGKVLTDEFIEQTDAYVVLRRYGTTQNRRYDKIGENEYRNARGSTFRFVSDIRGIWISPDKSTVYQLRKR